MVLQVDFERFAEEAKARLGAQSAYVRPIPSGSRATAADPEKGLIVAADTPKSPQDAKAALESQGCTVLSGSWSLSDSAIAASLTPETFVAAVAYRSADSKPGVWLDAFVTEPTPQEVLLTLFEEFRANGEVADVAFEEFLRLASPNVVVVRPEQLRYFVEQKQK